MRTRIGLALLFLPFVMGFEWEGRIGRLERQYSGGDTAERQQAVRMLGAYGAAEVRSVLLRALEDPEGEVRIEAAVAAGRVKLGEAVVILTGWLEDLDSDIRAAAARALGAIGDERPLPLLIRALGDADADVRRAAIGALSAIGSPDAVVPLLGRLDDEDANVRIEAAHALGRSADPRAVVPLIGRARDVPEMRTAVYQALAELGDARGASALIQGLRDDDENARISAIAALGRVGTERAMRPLAELVHESDPRAAEAAVRALGNVEGAAASRLLVELLGEATLRSATSEVIRERRDPELTLHLAGVMADASPLEMPPYARALEARLAQEPLPATAPFIERAIASLPDGNYSLLAALARSGEPTVLVRLLGALDSAPGLALTALEHYFALHPGDGRAADPLLAALPLVNAPSRPRVVRLLGQVGAARTSPALITLSHSDATELREAAVEAIGLTGGEGVVEALFEHLRDGDDASLRHKAALGVARLAGAEHIQVIVERLDAPPPVDRHAYLVALSGILRRHPLEGASAARFMRLAESFIGGQDASLASRVVETLGAWGSESAIALLRRAPLELLPAAIMALGDHASAEGFVLEHLTHGSPRVRTAAASRAGEHSARALPVLLDRLRESAWPEPAAISFAIARIAFRGELPDSAAEPLCEALRTRDPAARTNLLLALGRLPGDCDVPAERWTQLPHAASVRGAARRYLAMRGQAHGDECGRESHQAVAPLCLAVPEATYDGRVELYIYDRARELSRQALVSLWLADGTVMVAPTDARGFIHFGNAPAGRVIATDPLRTPLEP